MRNRHIALFLAVFVSLVRIYAEESDMLNKYLGTWFAVHRNDEIDDGDYLKIYKLNGEYCFEIKDLEESGIGVSIYADRIQKGKLSVGAYTVYLLCTDGSRYSIHYEERSFDFYPYHDINQYITVSVAMGTDGFLRNQT
jgi:hypothetical protein